MTKKVDSSSPQYLFSDEQMLNVLCPKSVAPKCDGDGKAINMHHKQTLCTTFFSQLHFCLLEMYFYEPQPRWNNPQYFEPWGCKKAWRRREGDRDIEQTDPCGLTNINILSRLS